MVKKDLKINLIFVVLMIGFGTAAFFCDGWTRVLLFILSYLSVGCPVGWKALHAIWEKDYFDAVSYTHLFRELYDYREMLKSLVRKDLKTRYKGSVLGFLWTFINPLMQLAIYALIFPYLMRVQEKNYAMFMFVALLPWIFFSTSLQSSTECIVENYNPVSYTHLGQCQLCQQ